MASDPQYARWVRQLFPAAKPARLTPPALETLAIIAYRQPITRADVEAVRGVAIESVLQTLMERGLVKIAGRAEVPGRPLLYETTQFFLEHFGLRNLDELPNAEELKRRELPTAPNRGRSPPPEAAPVPRGNACGRIDLTGRRVRRDFRACFGDSSRADIPSMNKLALGFGRIAAPGASLFNSAGARRYNRLVTLEQTVNKKWADVQSVYQRRADLIPNLVNTVQGAANFEKSTLTEVTNARASVGQVKLDPNKAPTDAAELEKFQQAQGQLSTALSRLLVVSENYPQLRATEAFQNLQAQLEGTENRISVERNNFNTAVQEYNTALGSSFRRTC